MDAIQKISGMNNGQSPHSSIQSSKSKLREPHAETFRSFALWSWINVCLRHVYITGRHTLLFHCVCSWKNRTKLYFGILMGNQTVYNYLLVIIRFHLAYTQLSAAGWPPEHQVKTLSQALNAILTTTPMVNATRLAVCCFQRESRCVMVLYVDLHPGSYCSNQSFKPLFIFVPGLAVWFVQEKTDSVSLTMFAFF